FHYDGNGKLQPMIYMEDLYCPGIRIDGEKIKSGGQKLMEALCTKFAGVDFIEWVAADDNPVAHRFYTRIESVVKSHEGVYDLSQILEETNGPDEYLFDTTVAHLDDFGFLNNQLGSIDGLWGALQAEHTKVLYVTNDDGQILLALFANKNFSSFRNVTGFETVQPAYAPGHTPEVYQAALEAGFAGLAQHARAENLDGHLFACFAVEDQIGQKFLTDNNHGFLLMRDDAPESRLRKITWPHPVRRELTEKWVADPGDSFSIRM
ncbi:MAG TPA: hypothetical protein PKW15_07165, partial [Alphaproteobacteria bacterium]|nr:hypothetical protein [Alphaproteobacteria bacterium]